MRRNFLLTLAWDGTDFEGWQRGPGGSRTLQGTLESALGELLGEAVEVTGASRTDAGVHAEGQAASFHSRTVLDPGRIVEGLDRCLPPDFACLGCREVDPRFHARYRAKAKEYRYRLHVASRPDPFARRYSLRVGTGLDLAAMKSAASLLVGSHDFTAFCNDRKDDAKAGRIEAIDIRTEGLALGDRSGKSGTSGTPSPAFVDILVRGEAFRYNQVRIMAASILEAGKGRLALDAISRALASGRRESLPGALGPYGLCLMRVIY